MRRATRLLAVVYGATLAACSTGGGGAPQAGGSMPAAPTATGPTCTRSPLAIHQGKNTLLLEGDALSVRAFAPYFGSTTAPVFSFAFKIPGASANPHPFDLTSDSSGRLYVVIFDDLVQGIAIYDTVPACTNASIMPDAILSGPRTGLERAYSVAVDRTGKIYVANVRNDGESEIAIFAPGSTGDVPPIATIRGPNTHLGELTEARPGFTKSVRVDSNFNVYTSNSIGQIAIFAAGSTGNVAPARIIVGSNTQLVDPTIALGSDASIYAANFEGDSITVYAPGASGNVAPVRVLKGWRTRIELPFAVAVCSDGLFYVASLNGVLAFLPNSNGNVSPEAAVFGGESEIFQPTALGF